MLQASGFGNESFPGEPKFELYDMIHDPLEMENVANVHPDIVAGLRQAYEKWFADVSNTRPENYLPPRIQVGTPYENPTVLTRQDWRRLKGNPWEQDANGYWMLDVTTTGNYDIRLRFPKNKLPGEALLKLSNSILKQPISRNMEELTFSSVSLETGNLDLSVTLKLTGQTRGPWQIDIIK